MTEDKEGHDIGEQWVIPSQDDFSIGMVEPVRKTATGVPDKAFIYFALGVNAFVRTMRTMVKMDINQKVVKVDINQEADIFINIHVQNLKDDFTKERLEQVERIVTGSLEPTEGDPYKYLAGLIRSSDKGSQFSTEKLVYAVLALHAMSVSAACLKSTETAVDPDSKLSADEKVFAKFLVNSLAYLLEEFTSERYEQVRRKAAIRGMLGQLTIQ